MRRRLLLVLVFGLVGATAGAAEADEGDAPSGPEACLVEAINLQRSGDDLIWSGTIQDELRSHAAAMAVRGEVDHSGMGERVAGLPEGWITYGEASGAHYLTARDADGVERWCQEMTGAFWRSQSHRDVLADGASRFLSVGTAWDGEKLWVTVGVFSHPDYRPASIVWPASVVHGLTGTWEGRFSDDDDSVFEGDIERLVAAGVTRGCNPPSNSRFCPEQSVTRAEMAAFLTRALEWEPTSGDHFTDDGASVFEGDIEALVRRQVTEGCNPPDNDLYCPDRRVTRGEMATFLARALGLEPLVGRTFSDTGGSIHAPYIEAVAAAGITTGCNPEGSRYCPDRALTRAQMAAFLVRAGLAG